MSGQVRCGPRPALPPPPLPTLPAADAPLLQDLAVRLVALGAVAVVANVPLGMWRAHLRKLSPAW